LSAKKNKKAIAFFGTGSFAGKSLLAAAFCRILADKRYRVSPFKAQNMSLNSYVTKDNKEIARAQAFQAFAAGVEAKAEMNPILLKPKGNLISQVIVKGEPYKDMEINEYYKFANKNGIKIIKESLQKLYGYYDFIVIEGAGSCAEINLYDKDIANFKTAEIANADVFLAADIERGGAFASIYGTISLLSEKHKKMVKGIIINKFRGDKALLKTGIEKIEKLTEKPVIGIVPFIENIKIPEEDSMGLAKSINDGEINYEANSKASIAVIRLPLISNFTDFDALTLDGRVNLKYVSSPAELEHADAVIIPGTKNTIAAMEWLRERGFEEQLKKLRGKVPIIGICGGYQILGREIMDSGIEGSEAGRTAGLGFLDIATEFKEYGKEKSLTDARIVCRKGIFGEVKNGAVKGYEIHVGKSRILSLKDTKIAMASKNKTLGACDKDGMVFGCYVHGLFDLPELRNSLLSFIIKKHKNAKREKTSSFKIHEVWEDEIRKIAEVIKSSIAINEI